MAKHLIAFVTAFYASFLNILGSSFVETAAKGLIGGLTGYLGTVLMTWTTKQILLPTWRGIKRAFQLKRKKNKK